MRNLRTFRLSGLVAALLVVTPVALSAVPDVFSTQAMPGGKHQCGGLPPSEAKAFQDRVSSIDAKPMRRPQLGGSSLERAGPPLGQDPEAGLVPSDYVSPVELVRDEGHLRHEVEVHLPELDGQTRLEQVLSFEAPQWARMMLVEFVPDDPAADQGNAGLFLRPNNPFVGGTYPKEPEGFIFDLTELETSAYNQAAYRSENPYEDGLAQYVLVTRDMDPAPAGKLWHVALGQMRDDREINGTLKVRFSGLQYRAPLAIQFYYDAEEEAQQVGFFDPTPREPDGDNPGRTQGEAMRWVLFQAAEELLEHLDFDGFLPVRILVTTDGSDSGNLGVAGGTFAAGISPYSPAPGRLRARPPGEPRSAPGGPRRAEYQVPVPAFEREAGTDACRARPGNGRQGICGNSLQPNPEVLEQPGQAGSARGFIEIRRDFEITAGPDAGSMWRWDKNLKDMTGRPNIVSLIKHELMHVLGFAGPVKSQTYVATFEPPRLLMNAPITLDDEDVGVWFQTETRQHFYGPLASMSEDNPWRHTPEPGPRLNDSEFSGTHLMYQDGDELAAWEPGKDFMRRSQFVREPQDKVGVTRDIMLDVGYARGTWSIQDRRLPRHWYDPERSGHGLDFRRVERENGSMQHFLHFYTYDSEDNPEWYVATGELSDRMVFESTLDYVTWQEGRNPRAQADPTQSGQIRLDLDPPVDHPACKERRGHDPNGNEKWLFAVLEFDLPDGSGTWCLEPLRFGREPAFPQEGSGSWYSADASDSGWGLSVMTRNFGPRPIINSVVYYYDEAGDPTWAIGVEGGDHTLPYGAVGNGVEIDMQHVHGFCRTCEPTATPTEPAGTLQIQINGQSAADNNQIMLLDLMDRGPVGGHWHRENVEIQLLSSQHPKMAQ